VRLGHHAVPAAFALSAAFHVGIYALIQTVPTRAAPSETVAVEIIEEAKPPPELKPEPPPHQPVRPIAAVSPKVTRSPPPSAQLPPPPPNSPPPPDAPPPAKAPIRIGISMESTTTSGAMAAPVGNTLYGKMPDQAPDPASVKPYRADSYAPPSEVTTLPEPIDVSISKQEYPEEARKLGVEGEVKLRLLIDESGRVREARLIKEPGHGLGDAAIRSALRFRFRPARRGEQPVATMIPFTVRYELP
jgi:protein TonB